MVKSCPYTSESSKPAPFAGNLTNLLTERCSRSHKNYLVYRATVTPFVCGSARIPTKTKPAITGLELTTTAPEPLPSAIALKPTEQRRPSKSITAFIHSGRTWKHNYKWRHHLGSGTSETESVLHWLLTDCPHYRVPDRGSVLIPSVIWKIVAEPRYWRQLEDAPTIVTNSLFICPDRQGLGACWVCWPEVCKDSSNALAYTGRQKQKLAKQFYICY